MNTILKITLIVLGMLILSGLLGWLIAKWKFRRKMKQLDKQMNTPETLDYVNKQLNEQQKTTDEREVRENDRRRAIFRGYGDRTLIPIELGRREQNIESTAGQHLNPGTDEGRNNLPNPIINQVREDKQPVGRESGNSEENEQEHSWDW